MARWGVLLAALTWLIFTTHAAPVTALSFSPSGDGLVSNGARGIDLRSASDGSVQRRIPYELPKITSFAFHPRLGVLAVAGGIPGQKGEVRLLDWPDGRLLHQLTNEADVATCVAFSPDGSLLAVANAAHEAHVWRLSPEGTALEEIYKLSGHSGPVLAIAFSPGGESVVTGGADRSLKVWSTGEGQLLRSLSYHTESVHALAFQPRPNSTESPATCASAGDDATIRIWQPGIGRMVRIIRYHEGPIFALAYASDGQSLFSAGKEGVIRRIDAGSDRVLGQWKAHQDWIYSLAISPDGSKLASGDWSGNVRVWDLRSSPGGAPSPTQTEPNAN